MPELLKTETMGPVDVAMITFETGDFDAKVAPALADLQESGTVKVMDVAFMRKAANGATSIVELADDTVADAFGRIAGSQVELLSEADLNDLARGLAPGSSAMVVVWENCWATRFASAIRASHGQVAMLERIPRETVERAISALGEQPSGGSEQAG